MARDGLLVFTSFAGGSAVTSATKLTSAALQILPFTAGHRRELVARININVSATTGTPTGIGWVFSIEASKDGTNYWTVGATPGQVLGATTTATYAQLPDGMKTAVTAGVPDYAAVQVYLPINMPQTFVDSTNAVADNYNYVRVTATPILNGGTTPNVTYTASAAIVSGKDGAYS